MRSKYLYISICQNQAPMKEDHLNNLLSMKKATDAY